MSVANFRDTKYEMRDARYETRATSGGSRSLWCEEGIGFAGGGFAALDFAALVHTLQREYIII